MRDLLTYLGIGLIVLLAAAFSAPLLMDFDAHRGRVAEELSAATGAHIALDGPISLQFFPTPRLSADRFAISGDFGAARAEKAFFELKLPALLQGRMQFAAARLDGAEITVATDKARRLAAASTAMQFDRLVLRDSKVTLTQAGAPDLRIELPDFSAQAASLAGPFQGRGALALADMNIGFTFASDTLAKNLLPLKANFTAPGAVDRLELDGQLNFTAAPAFEGQAKAGGEAAPGAWQAQADLVAGLGGVVAENISARLGQGGTLGPLADKITGKASYETRSGKIALDLAAPTLAATWTSALAGPLLAASESARPLDLHLAVDALRWRDADWTQARYDRQPGGPARLRGEGPGESRFDIVVASNDRAVWRGKLAFKTQDFPTFVATLPEVGPLAAANVPILELNGDLTLSPDEMALTGAALRLGSARFGGDARFRPAKDGRRAFLAARLAAPALDLDAAPDLGAPLIAGVDLDLSLEAQTVKIARNGRAYGEAGQIKAHFLRKDDAAILEKLDMRNIGGADLTASGGWNGDFDAMKGEARLKAADVSELTGLLARLSPGAVTRALAARGRLFSPADLTARTGVAGKGFELTGALGGTRISASLAPRADGKLAAALDLTAADGGILLNQFGAPLLAGQKFGPARVTARAQADVAQADKLNLKAVADLAGLHGEFHGLAGDPLTAPSLDGDLVLAGDMAKILAGLVAAPLPAHLSARLSAQPDAVSLQNLAGDWGGAKVSGALSLGAEGWSGRLDCARLSAPALVALALGPPAPVKPGALWSSLSFTPIVTDPPRAKIAVETGDLQPFGGRARFDLALGPGLLTLADAHFEGFGGQVSGGQVSGALNLRREGGRVTLAGDAELANIELKSPAFAARLDGRLNFAGEGASAAALVGSLAGSGGAKARDITVAGAAATAPDEALAASEASDAPFDAARVAATLDDDFRRGALRLGAADFSVSLAEGRLNLSQQGESPVLEAHFNLRDASLALTVSIGAQKRPEGWAEAPPGGQVIWSGSWTAPVRRVESTTFVNAVAARALEREQARIEALKAQDRERLRALSSPLGQAAEPPH